MSKGSYPPTTKRNPKPSPRAKAKGAGEGGSGGSTSTPKCWNFLLTAVTPAAGGVRSGSTVDGVPQGSRVMVIGDGGTLGYAPSNTSIEMIAEVRRTGGMLRGQVISNGTGKKGVEVQLCIS